MKKNLLLLTLAASFLMPLTAIHAVETLEQRFETSPPSVLPGVYWYFNDGNLNSTQMTAELENMKEVGLNIGDPASSRARMSEIWGARLDRGATTFWEGYDAKEKRDDAYVFYDRPFAKSLCHSSGAGPVMLLSELILGLRPIADGWKRFSVEPNLGDLKWPSATVPTPHGDIEVDVEGCSLNLRVPADTPAEYRGETFAGPYSPKIEMKDEFQSQL
jgi:hypothetical protein